jgi:hypothetical protein
VTTPLLVEEEAPFQKTLKSAKNKNIVIGSDTKNDCADKSQQQSTGLEWNLVEF